MASTLPVTEESIALVLSDYDISQSEALAMGVELLHHFEMVRKQR